jgi:hypothetical protein
MSSTVREILLPTAVRVAFVVGAVALAAPGCKKGGASTTPEACVEACESECPNKGTSGPNLETYLSCVDDCNAKCGGPASSE